MNTEADFVTVIPMSVKAIYATAWYDQEIDEVLINKTPVLAIEVTREDGMTSYEYVLHSRCDECPEKMGYGFSRHCIHAFFFPDIDSDSEIARRIEEMKSEAMEEWKEYASSGGTLPMPRS